MAIITVYVVLNITYGTAMLKRTYCDKTRLIVNLNINANDDGVHMTSQ